LGDSSLSSPTLFRSRLPVLFILSNNDAYASNRINQEREYPGRVSGTSLFNPDFVQIAQAFGMPAFRIEDAAQVDSTVERAMAMDGPVFIEVRTDLGVSLPSSQ